MSAGTSAVPTAAGATSALPAAWVGFLDDAAVFPPGRAPLPRAVEQWFARLDTVLAPVAGPLVLPLDDLDAARDQVRRLDPDRPLDVSVVVPAGRLDDALTARSLLEPELRVAALELKVSDDDGTRRDEIAAVGRVAAELPVFVELTAGQVDDDLDLLAEHGLRLKFRTGGMEAALFPSPEELADVIVAAVAHGVPFKLTAGLHEAVRYTDTATGFTHHGFLNIARAVDAAQHAGGNADGRDEVLSALRQTDAGPLTAWAAAGDTRWRTAFLSFGTCSIAEPLESLAGLGLFPAALLTPAHPRSHPQETR